MNNDPLAKLESEMGASWRMYSALMSIPPEIRRSAPCAVFGAFLIGCVIISGNKAEDFDCKGEIVYEINTNTANTDFLELKETMRGEVAINSGKEPSIEQINKFVAENNPGLIVTYEFSDGKDRFTMSGLTEVVGPEYCPKID